jgi:hypothetical protein
MPKFFVQITTQYEVEADDADEALANYKDTTEPIFIVNREVFDENMDYISEEWDDDEELEDDED